MITKGRSGKPKPDFTFSNGVTVKLNRLGPLIAIPIMKRYKPPVPPTQAIETGPNQFREVENPSHPDYIAAIAAHEALVSEKIQDAMLELGIDKTSVEIDEDQVKSIREYIGDVIAADTDFLVYLKYCVVASNDDLILFARALKNYDKPSEEGISSAKLTFPGEVPETAN